MVTLEIDLSDVLDETHDDDVVVVWPPTHREGSRGQVIAPRKRTIPLAGGKATVEVEPGPLNVQIRAQDGRVDGETRRLTVPGEGPVTLTALFDSAGAFTYAPPVLGQVAQMRDDAEAAAMRAEGVADTFGSLEGVADQVRAASDAASSASGSASAAASSASAAATSEGDAAGSASSADTSASSAASSASAAAGGASAAVGAAEAAAGSESQAASSASAAASSASAAASGACAADSAATRAEDVAESTHWQDDRLSVMGQLGPSLKGPKGDKGAPGDGNGDVLWSELNPVLDGKAPEAHNHHGDHYTKAQADGRYVSTSGSSTKTGNLNMDGGSVGYIRPDTTGGWARGFWWYDRDYTNIAGIGVLGDGSVVDYFYIGHGETPWLTPVFRAYSDFISITNLDVTGAVTGIEAGDVGAAPATHTHTAAQISDATTTGRNVLKASSQAAARTAIGAGTSNLALGSTSSTAAPGNHTHSQYAESSRVTALEGSQPIIVSEMDPNPLPGRIYFVTG